jgi:hypothetical protein
MYTRKIDLKELILELDCLDETTVSALENTKTGIEWYDVEYTVTRKGVDDYDISPSPSDLAYECVGVVFYAILPLMKCGAELDFLTVLKGIEKDGIWWENENRDRLIDLSEDRFEDE